jgi:mannose-6-phosphate isomerase-like protein (cupin superfamily)
VDAPLFAYADESLRLFAPDGIEIVPIPLAGLRYLAVVEGRIPPGRYPAHFHYSLEQVTYVLEGTVEVTTWDANAAGPAELTLGPGTAIVTLPTQTLAFANPGPGTARVLFITAPPYPQDDSDTQLVEGQRPPTAAELKRSAARHHLLVDTTRSLALGRLAALLGHPT